MPNSTIRINKGGEIVVKIGSTATDESFIYGMIQLLPILLASSKSHESVELIDGGKYSSRECALHAIKMIYSAALASAEERHVRLVQSLWANSKLRNLAFPSLTTGLISGYMING